ncbi:hypothetical protein Tco_0794399 [Tanacetum coccineum]
MRNNTSLGTHNETLGLLQLRTRWPTMLHLWHLGGFMGPHVDSRILGLNGFGPAEYVFLPVPCQRNLWTVFCLLVRAFVVLILPLGSVIQLPLVLSLAFGKSADLFVHTFLKLHYWTLTLEVSQTFTLITGCGSLIPSSSRIPTLPGYVANLLAIPALYSTLPIVVTFPLSLGKFDLRDSQKSRVPLKILDARLLSLSDSTFSGGGDDKGSVAATRKMICVGRLGADSSIGTASASSVAAGSGSFVGTADGSLPELDAHPLLVPSSVSTSSSFACHHQMTPLSILYQSTRQDGQQDPPQGPPYPLPD